MAKTLHGVTDIITQLIPSMQCIEQPDLSATVTLVIEHDVLRLQVPINDPVGVEVAEGHRDLSQVETEHILMKHQ